MPVVTTNQNLPTPTISTGSSPKNLMTRERQIEIVRIMVTGFVIFLHWNGILPVEWLWVAVTVGLYPLVKTGIFDLIQEHKIGTEIFVSIATLVALFGGEPIAGAVLMVIILIAEFIAELNTDRARAAIQGLIGSVPQTAVVRINGQESTVSIKDLKIRDIVLVRAGEKVPVDGTVVGGGGAINEAPITGESLPKDKEKGAEVFAGTVLESGAMDVQTDRIGADTTFARIVKLVEEAEQSQAPVQRLADKVAAWLIPVVFVFLIVVFLITRDVRKVVTLMIFTSPAELGLATPMVMIAAIARAAQNGILVKGGAYLESLAKVDAMAFDKTGTLTIGKPAVEAMEVLDTELSERELLRYAAAADRRSAHPLAKAIIDYAASLKINVPEPTAFEVLRGRGVIATVEGEQVLVGNEALLVDNGIEPPKSAGKEGKTTIYIAVNDRLAGLLHIADQLRPGVKEVLSKLRVTGVRRLVMLTGDNVTTAKLIASQIGVDEIRAELLPEAKIRAIDELQREGFCVAMIGDGINDAPALAKADVGIAMGAGGTQAALEAADVALMTDDLSKIVMARAIAKKAYRTIQENLFFGVGVVHLLGIAAALLGWIGPIQAAIIHLGPDILVFLNSVKLLRVPIEV